MKYILNFPTYGDYLAAEGGGKNFKLDDWGTGWEWYTQAVVLEHFGEKYVIFNNNNRIVVDSLEPGIICTYLDGRLEFILGDETYQRWEDVPRDKLLPTQMLLNKTFVLDTSVTTSITIGDTFTAYKGVCDEDRIDFWLRPYNDTPESCEYKIYAYERGNITTTDKEWYYIGIADNLRLVEDGRDDRYTYKTVPGVSLDKENQKVKFNQPNAGKIVVTYVVETTSEPTPILSEIENFDPEQGAPTTGTFIPALEILESACLENGTNVPLEHDFVFPETGDVKVYYTLKAGATVTPMRMFGQAGPGGEILNIKNIELPDTIKYIGGNFLTGANPEKFVIPDSVLGIAPYEPLLEVQSIKSIVYGSGLKTISDWFGHGAQENNLKNITIKDGVKFIGESAFYYCYNVREVVIPDSVEKISYNAFGSCNLDKLVLGSGLTYIDEYAFSGCYIKRGGFVNNSSFDAEANNYWGGILYDYIADNNLIILGTKVIGVLSKDVEEVVVPNGVTEITNGVFVYNNLRKIVLPQSLEVLDAASNQTVQFFQCHNLQEIVCYATTAPALKSGTFGSVLGSIGRNGVLKYPAGSDYSSWLQTANYYLGSYGWTGQEI